MGEEEGVVESDTEPTASTINIEVLTFYFPKEDIKVLNRGDSVLLGGHISEVIFQKGGVS